MAILQRLSIAAALLPALVGAATPQHRHTETGHFPGDAFPAGDYVSSAPPLWDNLGTLTYPVTTVSPKAQRYFDQGLRLAYAFNHLEAQRAFRMAQKLDPGCALCFWGEALVLGPNINAPMEPSALAPAQAALARATALAGSVSAVERGLIEALTHRYASNPGSDRRKLDLAYADAMGRLAADFPDDPQIPVLYAESLMDLSPWSYWSDGGTRPNGRTSEIVALLEKVLARNPDHPGAIHYYIHTVEASDRPERAEPHARRLAGLMPGAGHLVHMPGHLYYRLGQYRDALEANRDAVAVDEAYLRRTGATGLYAQGYYPHNVHFLMASAQMAGDGDTALSAAGKLAGLVNADTMRKVPWTQPVRAAPYFAHAQYGEAGAVMALPDPGAEFPYVQAAWRYARGMACAAAGSLPRARSELSELRRIARQADFAALNNAGIPAADVLRIAEQVLTAHMARAQGRGGDAVAAFEAAAILQARLPYMEPPFWYYPVRRSVGAQKLLAGDLEGAEADFDAALDIAPNDAWSLQGLAEVHRRRGDMRSVRKVEEQLRRTQAGETGRVDLKRI